MIKTIPIPIVMLAGLLLLGGSGGAGQSNDKDDNDNNDDDDGGGVDIVPGESEGGGSLESCTLQLGDEWVVDEGETLDAAIVRLRQALSTVGTWGWVGAGVLKENTHPIAGWRKDLYDGSHQLWLVDNSTFVRAFLRATLLTAVLALDGKVRAARWPGDPANGCWAPGGPPVGVPRLKWAGLQVARATFRAIAANGAGVDAPQELKSYYGQAASSSYGDWSGLTLATAAEGYTQLTWPRWTVPPRTAAPATAPDGAGGPAMDGSGGVQTYYRALQLTTALCETAAELYLGEALDLGTPKA